MIYRWCLIAAHWTTSNIYSSRSMLLRQWTSFVHRQGRRRHASSCPISEGANPAPSTENFSETFFFFFGCFFSKSLQVKKEGKVEGYRFYDVLKTSPRKWTIDNIRARCWKMVWEVQERAGLLAVGWGGWLGNNRRKYCFMAPWTTAGALSVHGETPEPKKKKKEKKNRLLPNYVCV